jgi:hypothetical protein
MARGAAVKSSVRLRLLNEAAYRRAEARAFAGQG